MKVSNMQIPFTPHKELQEKLNNLTFGNYNHPSIHCRDPFIMLYGDKYYFYSRDTSVNQILCFVSDDLIHWSDPLVVYTPPKDFHGICDCFWAPECHYYKGNFYIFTSVFSSKNKRRTISVYKADNPLGPFEDIANGAISPLDWYAIDGTLYIDKEGAPWLVFVHEWVCMPDGNGSMVAARLSEDFTHLISEPIHLFFAQEPDWATRGVTDGPYMVRTKDGALRMIWSNFSKLGYVVAQAHSDNGEITGKWIHDGLLYQKDLRPEFKLDGGHGMIFQAKNGDFFLSLHTPNTSLTPNEKESLFLVKVEEDENGLFTSNIL